MRRFFLSGQTVGENRTVTIGGDLFRHMVRVLRLKVDTRVLLADDDGHEFSGAIKEIGKGNLVVTIDECCREAVSKKGPRITLYQGLPKGDKMELILQKCTELGVDEIVAFSAERSVGHLPADREEKRLERWQRIAREAARQSGRSTIPRIIWAESMEEALKQADQPLKLLLWEAEQEKRLKETFGSLPAVPTSIGILVGPEGGLTSHEAHQGASHGFVPVTLGKRILRTETAGLAMLAILQFYWGDMG